MFKISNSKAILQLASLLFVICDFTLCGQRKCAEYNEYCQEHWECCSNTCLTYSYRCIGRKKPIPAFDRPMMTLEHLLESVAVANTNLPTAYNQSTSRNDEKHNNALSKSVDVNITSGIASEQRVGQKRFAAVEAFVRQSKQLIQKQNRLAKQNLSTEKTAINTATTDKQEITDANEVEQSSANRCKQIGEKCYRSEDCCNRRCHDYLHQCVT